MINYYHNAKFDLGVFRTFLGFDMPEPYWDTLIISFLFNQSEDHGLKALYNKYIAVEDEGVNRFDTLFKGVTFDYVPLTIQRHIVVILYENKVNPFVMGCENRNIFANGSEIRNYVMSKGT